MYSTRYSNFYEFSNFPCLPVSLIFFSPPPPPQAATGEKISTEDLGGADVHCRISGCTDHYVETEEESCEVTRRVISSLNLSRRRRETREIEVAVGKDILTEKLAATFPPVLECFLHFTSDIITNNPLTFGKLTTTLFLIYVSPSSLHPSTSSLLSPLFHLLLPSLIHLLSPLLSPSLLSLQNLLSTALQKKHLPVFFPHLSHTGSGQLWRSLLEWWMAVGSTNSRRNTVRLCTQDLPGLMGMSLPP